MTPTHSNSSKNRRLSILQSHLFPGKTCPMAGNGVPLTHHHSGQGILNTPLISPNSTCGIIAIASNSDTSQQLFEGLTILQNRGYDSAGIATFNSNKSKLSISKFASVATTSDALDQLKENLNKHLGDCIGIAHTRWATHGAKTDVNAHPHTDRKNRLALVHNGVIENSNILKRMLMQKYQIQCVSETDTEVIAQLIGVHLDQGLDILEAIKQSVSLLEGTWGLVVLSLDQPDQIIATRNGSPLLVGLSEHSCFIASESSAFVKYTRDMISLNNGEIVIITKDGVKELISNENIPLEKRVILAPQQEVELTPDPYPHWTLKEIMEQPQALARSLNFGGRISSDSEVKMGGLEENRDWLLNIRHLIVAACGTSYFSGLYGARLMRYLKCFDTVQVIDAAELDHDDLPSKDTGLLVISQSGETSDVVRCLDLARECGVPSFSIVNKVGSLVARMTGCGAYINAGRENAVASTKAFTCQVTVLTLIALWFAQNRKTELSTTQKRKDMITTLHRLPISVGMNMRIQDQCRQIAQHLIKKRTMFVLGKGYGECIAREGSLKLKEITYVHAEAYSSGALKHGPFALIEEGTPIIVLCLNDKYLGLNCTAVHEVKARGAYVICITDAPEKVEDIASEIIQIPTNGELTALNAVVPLQFLAYEMAVAKGLNPDKPRNLAKTVTVA
uniref:Glutamine--fructose-6-phosphate aminotransferase [isomerizing] n=1 Tax=Percolomonas cosmopolitus TaxID=63605 RepID=A0A7S1KQ41_9EUKA|mmetsp:Transcript_4755/g.17828  ORF Transcript_4755/g.17828 Transcript_4755/m.17828 type:complete len:677 (+) Transcript_4755:165-2195(+)|eukprot:CAMPEP_0117448110 /NCGR_PEP_ID=MMETSP0759-20121206/7227_1 /TAXON_ID=63605 /ORGANISM="Percolomonas cosmopolitus, Strain WS" /LENGTH=676 /DNA_ID=CAMNT_0005240477 /DNA_START=14 /DNA_END=2044 /DNA_ORIENTATION=-